MTMNSNLMASKWDSGGIRKTDFGFWKTILGTKIPNSISKSRFWDVSIWFWRTIFGTKFWKLNQDSKIWQGACPNVFWNLEVLHQDFYFVGSINTVMFLKFRLSQCQKKLFVNWFSSTKNLNIRSAHTLKYNCDVGDAASGKGVRSRNWSCAECRPLNN